MKNTIPYFIYDFFEVVIILIQFMVWLSMINLIKHQTSLVCMELSLLLKLQLLLLLSVFQVV
jgi:hypothetical protein